MYFAQFADVSIHTKGGIGMDTPLQDMAEQLMIAIVKHGADQAIFHLTATDGTVVKMRVELSIVEEENL